MQCCNISFLPYILKISVFDEYWMMQKNYGLLHKNITIILYLLLSFHIFMDECTK
jgi:hypothetical protein